MMFIIERSPGKFGLVTNTFKIVGENFTQEQIVDELLELKRPDIEQAVKEYKTSLTWEEILCWSGRVTCCDCGGKIKKYNPKWPMDKQRCNDCLE